MVDNLFIDEHGIYALNKQTYFDIPDDNTPF